MSVHRGSLTKTLLAALAVLTVGVPARAFALDLLCPAGTQTVTFSPGVKTTSQSVQVTFSLDLGTCASLTHPLVTNGTSSGVVTVDLSCDDLLGTTTGTQTFTWSTGQTSVMSFTRTVTTVNAQTVITLAGTISSGLFAGHTAVLVVVEPALDLLACQSSEGLTSQSGVSTMTIL